MASLVGGVYTPGQTDPVTGLSVPGSAYPYNPGGQGDEFEDGYGIYGPTPPPPPSGDGSFMGLSPEELARINNEQATLLPYVPGPLPITPLVAGVAVVGLGMLVSRLGLFAGPAVFAVLKGFAGVAGRGRIAWSILPGWVKTALVSIGFVAGVDLALDVADIGPEQPGGGLTPLIPGPGEFAGSTGQIMDGATVVKSWTANGTPFVKLSNGKLGAMKRDGSWKFWRPKKPVVIFGGGMSNLKDLLRADSIIDKQVKRLGKAIRRRTTVRRAKCTVCGYVNCRCSHK